MPDAITAGTTLKYQRVLTDYKASDGWALKLQLAGCAELASTAAGDDHLITIPAKGGTGLNTSALHAGTYAWVEIVEKAGERWEVGSGYLTVIAAPSSLPTEESSPFWEQVKVKAEELYLARLTQGSDVKSFEVAGRQFVLETLEDIQKVLDVANAKLAALRSGRRFSVPVTMIPATLPWLRP